MKFILTLLIGMSVWHAGAAQFSMQTKPAPLIKSEKVKTGDLLEVMGQLGLDIYSFGCPADSLRPYDVIFTYDQYAGDSIQLSDRIALGRTYRYFTAGQGGPERVYCDRIRIFTSRLNNDKPVLGIALVGGGSMTVSIEQKTEMPYGSRPFAEQPFEENKKIPLVMYGSYWKDENGIVRFCGSDELTWDDEMLRLSPHYYIISVEFIPAG